MTYLITFFAQFDAILANRILIGLHIPVRLMPVPRVVSSSCGTCVEFELEPGEEIPLDRLVHVELEHIYRKGEQGWEQIQ